MYEGARPERGGETHADRNAFLALYELTAAERSALAEPDFGAVLDLGGLPNLVFRYYRAHGLALDEFQDHLSSPRSRT